MSNPYNATPTVANPLANNPTLSGPSPSFFYLLTGDNQGSALVDGTLPTTPALRKVLRAIKCVATGATLVLQSVGGGVVSVTFAVGDVHDLGYVIAITGIPNNTSFVGYV